jgi:hypothetical protein
MDKIILIINIPVKNRSISACREIIYDTKKYLDETCNDGSIIHYVFPSYIADDITVDCVNPKLIESDEYIKIKERLDSSLEMVDSFIKELQERKK